MKNWTVFFPKYICIISLLSCFATCLLIPSHSNADNHPLLSLPVACTPGEDCWIANYVDVNPENNIAQDYQCGPRSYDGHKGTDIAIADMVTMDQGVDVLAAADGTVRRFRDGIEDRVPSPQDIEKMKADNKGCGNGVFIDHRNGWQTIYCHMKKGSILVQEGQTVKRGDKIGHVGHSGIAEFPHLHLGVFFERAVIDPFTSADDTQGCHKMNNAPLWQHDTPFDYDDIAVFGSGFTGHAPDIEALKIDATPPKSLSGDSKALVFWMGYFGAAKDDKISMEITDPDGVTFVQKDNIQEKNRARQFYYVGKKAPDSGLRPGLYHATLTISRTGFPVKKISQSIQVK